MSTTEQKPKCTCTLSQACEQCYKLKDIDESVWAIIREAFNKDDAATTALPVKQCCPNCSDNKDIRVKPITYDCMECGATWTDKRDLPNPILKSMLKQAETKLGHNKIQLEERDETIERLQKELASKK